MKNHSFRFLWTGQGLANMGDVFYIVGLVSILYSMSESVLYLTLLPFVNTFGRFISGLLSPIVFNKYPLQPLLSYSQFGKTMVLLGLACWMLADPRPSIIGILLFIFTLAFLDGWAMPASRAMIPRLVGPADIVKANGFLSIVSQTIQLGGWALGGIVVAVVGGFNVLWLTLFLFVLSTVMMFLIKDEANNHIEKSAERIGKVLKEGWAEIWDNRLFRNIHVAIFLEAMAGVVWIAAIIYVYVAEVLHKGEAWWGYINTSFFLGLLLGGLICTKFAQIIELNLKKIMLFGSVGVSVLTLWFGLNSTAWLALGISMVFGCVEQIKSITFETFLQKETASGMLPKIYGAQESLTALTFGLSSLMFGAIAERFGVQSAFVTAGLLLAAGALYMVRERHHFPDQYLT
ncbi:MFS transporter [Halobacillus sp. A1]|uniref:MFS transporter n=1 Tax=Halobacillus sp. A1 TaxID=2880262 RepID=UPI0020A6D129|nr:MFS transporter [Halobacillus sp. A1]MCP3033316.1 MFS transporter [Halobacillus sp. A1]